MDNYNIIKKEKQRYAFANSKDFMKLIIQGPAKLSGEIKVNGAKNAAMKMIAACVLIPEKVKLENVPDILDIQNIIQILTNNGAKIERDGHTLVIDTSALTANDLDAVLVGKLRGSIVLIGPYLARFGKIRLPQPGGDAIGARPIDLHLEAFQQMGVEINVDENGVCDLKTSGLTGSIIDFKKVSVTATENALMAATLTHDQTTIKNAAAEPEIKDLADFLNQAGAKS